MKKIVLPLVVLLLAIGVASVLWTVMHGTEASPAADESSAKAPADAPPTESASSQLESESREKSADSRAGLPVGDAARSELEKWDPAKSVWVSGVVRNPNGCVDEAAEGFALKDEIDADDLARYLDPRKGDNDDARVLSRRPVAADGSFRLPFPPDSKLGYVGVRGRFLYAPLAKKVDLSRGDATVAIDASCGSWITGKVDVPADSPVPFSSLDGLKAEARTAAAAWSGRPGGSRGFSRRAFVKDGAFELRAVPIESPCTITAAPEQLAAIEVRVEDRRAGKEIPVRLAFLRGGVVRGVVRDPRGAPVASARVEAAKSGQWFGFDDRVVREGKSGADGSFELAAVSPGKVVMKAKADGFLEGAHPKIDVQDGGTQSGVELSLASGHTISGTVTWDGGDAAAKVEVNARFDMSQMAGMGAFNALKGATGDAKTDEQGAFKLVGMGEGPFTLEVQAAPRNEEKPEKKS